MINILLAITCLIIFFSAIKYDKRSVITGVSLNCAIIFALLHADQMVYVSDQLVWVIIWSYFILPTLLVFGLAVFEYFRKNKDGSLQGFEKGLLIKSALFLLFVAVYHFIKSYNFAWYVDTSLGAIDVVLEALLFIAHSYVVTAFVNYVNVDTDDVDYVVVLGARLDENAKVSGQLKSRCDTAIDFAKKNPNTKIIMSGAVSGTAEISEAAGMKAYAVERGFPAQRILLEEKAENTNENIRYSYDLMESESKFAIVSTNYHLQRGLLIARKYNMDCIGIPATTDWRTAALGFINEIFKYIRRSPLIPAIVIASSLIIYMLQKW